MRLEWCFTTAWKPSDWMFAVAFCSFSFRYARTAAGVVDASLFEIWW